MHIYLFFYIDELTQSQHLEITTVQFRSRNKIPYAEGVLR
jgi:hypothetical protein